MQDADIAGAVEKCPWNVAVWSRALVDFLRISSRFSLAEIVE
jgi:hypothetical protein